MSPAPLCDFSRNEFSNTPVKLNQGRVDGSDSMSTGGFNEVKNVVEVLGGDCCRGFFARWFGTGGLIARLLHLGSSGFESKKQEAGDYSMGFRIFDGRAGEK